MPLDPVCRVPGQVHKSGSTIISNTIGHCPNCGAEIRNTTVHGKNPYIRDIKGKKVMVCCGKPL
jgi:hypothetical protein